MSSAPTARTCRWWRSRALIRSSVATQGALAALGVQVVLSNSDRLSVLLRGVAVAAAATGGPDIRLPPLRTPTVNAIDYFGAHYAAIVHGRQLARLTNVSFFHLAHLFRADLGASIKEYMTSVRVEIVRQLVLESTDKIDQIAELTGFSDASHLSRVFWQCLGERPGQYRLRHGDRPETSILPNTPAALFRAISTRTTTVRGLRAMRAVQAKRRA